MRHAKSDRKNDPSINDFDRPLSRRGERDAPVMAARLADSGIQVDALVSSPACRALSTAEVFSERLNLPVQTDKRIYEADVAALQAVVRDFDDRFNCVALFGHNPGLSDFLCYLTEENYAELPTAGIAVIELPLKSWKHVFGGKGLLKNSLCPNRDELGMQNSGPVLSLADRFRFWRFSRAHRLELIMALTAGIIILAFLVPVIMRQSTDSSVAPQEGSASY